MSTKERIVLYTVAGYCIGNFIGLILAGMSG